jgi:simple sugar transport system permease protein
MRLTRLGFFIRVIGASPDTSRYAGIRTNRIFLVVMLLSGALCGLAGASQIGDFSHELEPRGLPAAQYAWTGIVVALVASLNPLGVIASALAIGGLRNAAFVLQGSEFPSGFVGIMEGLILFCIALGLALVHFRITRRPVDARETGRAALGELVGSEPFASIKGPEL